MLKRFFAFCDVHLCFCFMRLLLGFDKKIVGARAYLGRSVFPEILPAAAYMIMSLPGQAFII